MSGRKSKLVTTSWMTGRRLKNPCDGSRTRQVGTTTGPLLIWQNSTSPVRDELPPQRCLLKICGKMTPVGPQAAAKELFN